MLYPVNIGMEESVVYFGKLVFACTENKLGNFYKMFELPAIFDLCSVCCII